MTYSFYCMTPPFQIAEDEISNCFDNDLPCFTVWTLSLSFAIDVNNCSLNIHEQLKTFPLTVQIVK